MSSGWMERGGLGNGWGGSRDWRGFKRAKHSWWLVEGLDVVIYFDRVYTDRLDLLGRCGRQHAASKRFTQNIVEHTPGSALGLLLLPSPERSSIRLGPIPPHTRTSA